MACSMYASLCVSLYVSLNVNILMSLLYYQWLKDVRLYVFLDASLYVSLYSIPGLSGDANIGAQMVTHPLKALTLVL